MAFSHCDAAFAAMGEATDAPSPFGNANGKTQFRARAHSRGTYEDGAAFWPTNRRPAGRTSEVSMRYYVVPVATGLSLFIGTAAAVAQQRAMKSTRPIAPAAMARWAKAYPAMPAATTRQPARACRRAICDAGSFFRADPTACRASRTN